MARDTAPPDVTTRRVRYGELDGFLALPAGAGPHPAVILLHERYGLVQHSLDLAARFARDGYACLAPNLFARHPDQARLATGEITYPLSDPAVAADLSASIDYLRAGEPSVDAGRVAVMGVCQTGRYPLVLAAERDEVLACLVFYGAAMAPREWEVTERQPVALETLIGQVRCPVLGIFGEADHIIPVADVCQFRSALESSRLSYDIRIYAGAPHGWLNDTMPGRYRAEAAAAAWQAMLDFLGAVRGGQYPADRVRWRFESDIAHDYDPSRNVRLE